MRDKVGRSTYTSINELDLVVLTVDIDTQGLKAGDVGCVVQVYEEGRAYEIEFANLKGETIALVTLSRDVVRTPTANDISHVRAAE